MRSDLTDLTDGDLATALAESAARHLVALRQDRFGSATNVDAASAKALGAEADRTANEIIVSALRSLRPSDSILSEESTDDLARLDANRVWIVDPLDGTREYGDPGSTEWAVHIALWQRHPAPPSPLPSPAVESVDPPLESPSPSGTLILGVVGLPALGLVLRSDQPLASYKRDKPGAGQDPSRVRFVRSASRPQLVAEHVAILLDGELKPMGSAGVKAMAVVRGEADVYIHTGGQWEWDSAAPVAVAQAHGLFVARVDGSPMRYNQRDPYLPDLVICRSDLADQVMTALSQTLG